ncbi:MAG: hypothetical protein ABEJ83_02325, partial [Candidatus Nanohaloarchaea archaeon]
HMSLHGNFERLDDGFEFMKGEFGRGRFQLKASGSEVVVEEDGDVLASAELESGSDDYLKQLEYRLLDQLQGCEDGDMFLEVIGGSDYLKDFLDKLLTEEPMSN